jgi:CRISPR/Cas system-associated exonuclease Cas4 (RecB family)
MARYKTKLDKFDWVDFEAITSDDGTRVYNTPCGPAPSVTTILSTLPHPELDAWRERVGDEEADRVSKEATDIGTMMHDSLEAHLRKEEYDWGTDEFLLSMAQPMAKAIKLYGWKKLQEVWAIEIPLHFNDLYAGRVDLVGLYDNHPAVLDYKTTKFAKSDEYMGTYRMQISAYAMAIENMFGQKIEFGVNFFATRPNAQFRKTAESIIVKMDADMMQEYKIKWIEVLLGYYAEHDPSKIDNINAMIDLV